jgi:uncharacterized protein YbgA (DUF1722 family)/uncharacterized protein YbbK (DUF523 family)
MRSKRGDQVPLRVGISTCLLGQKVRYDGGHKRDRYLTDILEAYFDFVPVCPELEIGMGVPREAVRLVGSPAAPRMVGRESGRDWTDRMNKYSERRTKQIARMRLSGYILKKDSPSCGMERVKVFDAKGMPQRKGAGLFAMALKGALPLLPVEEEGRLHDARLRENFIVRVFAYHRLLVLFRGRWSRGQVVDFHASQKLLLMAHSQQHYRQLGQLVAAIKQRDPEEFRDEYSRLTMEALGYKTTTKKNVNVMQHMLGYLKKQLAAEDKKYILEVIEDYRHELVPLVVPLTLLKHYLEKHEVGYLTDQTYLQPHPKELMLRNHV